MDNIKRMFPMFICICNAIRDNELREAALACDDDVDGVYKVLGRIPQCRQCFEDAEEIITEERSARRAPACMRAGPEALLSA
jgi:bacterioferritin-associated ferredoxin